MFKNKEFVHFTQFPRVVAHSSHPELHVVDGFVLQLIQVPVISQFAQPIWHGIHWIESEVNPEPQSSVHCPFWVKLYPEEHLVHWLGEHS